MSAWGDRGHCPVCGKFCGDISALVSRDSGIKQVAGVCITHGTVDLSDQSWSYKDFDDHLHTQAATAERSTP